MMIRLRYGNTNTFYIPGEKAGLLVDTDYAGTIHAFYKALKMNGLRMKDIGYVMATHFHPDHSGLIGELMDQGVKLLLIDVQRDFVHFSDSIFAREKLDHKPIDEKHATVITCEQSRAFLAQIGIFGAEYLEAYEDNRQLKVDWELIRTLSPSRVFYAHAPEKSMN